MIKTAGSSLVGRLSFACGVALVVSACSGGTGSGGSSGGTPVSEVRPGRLELIIQPIQVCDDNGFVCAQVEFFEAVADKIWDQADIEITFLPLNQLNDSTYLTTDNDEFSDLSFSGDAGDFGRHPDSTRTQGPINLWFVDVIETSTGLIQFGNAWIGLNGVLISDDIFDFNNGAGRLDVIAHEIGHNLGLRHSTFGAGAANNLMTGGGSRTVPDSIVNITPDGDGLSQLNSAQIERVRESSFLTGAPVNDSLPVTEADAIAWLDADVPSGLLPVLSTETGPALVVAAAAEASSATEPISVPEAPVSWLTWLLLWPLGQQVHRHTRR